MQELVINHNGQPYTTSRLVAEKFERNHKDVLESIREIMRSAESSADLFFIESEYVDTMNRKQTMYLMNRDGFSLLVMGFIGERAMQFKISFIKAFNAMEQRLKRLSPGELSRMDILRMALESEQERIKLQKENKMLGPKAQYYDEVLQSTGVYTTQQIAKELGMSAITLNKLLYEKKIQYKQSETWMLYHAYQDKGYTKTKTHTYIDEQGRTQSRMHMVWTEAGRRFIHEKLKKNVQVCPLEHGQCQGDRPAYW